MLLLSYWISIFCIFIQNWLQIYNFLCKQTAFLFENFCIKCIFRLKNIQNHAYKAFANSTIGVKTRKADIIQKEMPAFLNLLEVIIKLGIILNHELHKLNELFFRLLNLISRTKMLAFLKLEKFDKIKIWISVNSSNSWLKNTNEWIKNVPSYL